MPERICSVDGCPEPVRTRGWCKRHYNQWYAHGDPLADFGRASAGEPQEWLALAVERTTDECIEWPFQRDVKGYGRMHNPETKKPILATHAALAAAGRTRPSGDHWALHSCDNPSCINPRHLRWGTAAENTADMVRRGRAARPNARLTPDDVREIRRLRGVELGQEVARRFGISPATVSEIQLRRRWRDIT